VNAASDKIPLYTVPKLLDGFHHRHAIEGTTQGQEQSKAPLTLRNAGGRELIDRIAHRRRQRQIRHCRRCVRPHWLAAARSRAREKGGPRGEGLHAMAVVVQGRGEASVTYPSRWRRGRCGLAEEPPLC
jgi:hypothetical protein